MKKLDIILIFLFLIVLIWSGFTLHNFVNYKFYLEQRIKKEVNSAIKTNITKLQEELTDFAEKQKELYDKTHREY